MPRFARLILPTAAAVLFVLAPSGAQAAPAITHGVVVGDVTASSAVLWARADREAILNVVLYGGRHGRIASGAAHAAEDYTARIRLEDLAPGTTYGYRAWFSLGAPGVSHGPAVEGSFRTAPSRESAAPLKLAFGGDLAGQNVCRDAAEGFPSSRRCAPGVPTCS